MDLNYSKAALLKFVDFLGEKGLANTNTVAGYKAACTKVLADVSKDEEADVRKVDVPSAIRRFNNKNPGLLSSPSLAEYQRRVGAVIKLFVDYTENPAGFKPIGRGTSKKQENGAKPADKPREKRKPADVDAGSREPKPEDHHQLTSGLPFSFPLRPNFLAQIVVPRDMRIEEAKRLSAFIMTLAMDYPT